MGFLDFLGKSVHQFLSGKWCRMKVLMTLPFSILQKLYMWEKYGFQVTTKNALGQSNFNIC